jgi:hypothetical protein
MSYRSDTEALEARKRELERRLSELRARQRENEQLSKNTDTLVRELEETYARLNVARAPDQQRRSLPLLQRIYVASPCNVPWESMQGDEHVRHCASCDKDVFDLSSLTREEAEALLIEKKGKLCAQYYRREDGTILTADCEVGVAKKKRARRKAAVVAGAFAAAAAGAIAGAFAMTKNERVEEGCAMQHDPASTTPAQPSQWTTTVTPAPPRGETVRGEVAFEPVSHPPQSPPRPNHPAVRGMLRVR